MRLALAQMNPVVGDLDGNRELILGRLKEAKANSADIVVFPELAVTGYPPEDLLLRPGFVRAAQESVERIAKEARGTTVLVGAPHFDRDLYNACYVCSGGEVKAVYRKRFLPNYGVFDEDRYFAPGRDLILLEHGTTLVGVTVCEDMWQPGPPATDLALAGAELLVNISASPFYVGRDRTALARRSPPRARARARPDPARGHHPRRNTRSFAEREQGDRGGRPLRGRARADASRPRARPARLRGQERIPRRGGRRLRRHRLGAHGRACRRGARSRSSPLRLDAVALLVGRNAHRRSRACREPRLLVHGDPDRFDRRRLRCGTR